jgi:hypothetical protein
MSKDEESTVIGTGYPTYHLIVVGSTITVGEKQLLESRLSSDVMHQRIEITMG